MICKKCSAQIILNGRFCSKCGAAASSEPVGVSYPPKFVQITDALFCSACGAKLPKGCMHCLICGVKAGEYSPVITPSSIAEPHPDNTVAASHRKHNSRLIAACVSTCALLIITAISIWFVNALPYLRSSYKTRGKGAVFYITGDINGGQTLKFITPSMSEPEVLSKVNSVNSGQAYSLAKVSPNGQYIAYLSEYSDSANSSGGTLFLRDFGRTPTLDSALPPDIQIDDYATSTFLFTDNSAYLVYLNHFGELLAFDHKSWFTIDTDVIEIIDHNENQILYEKKDGLYFKTIAETADAGILIDTNIKNLADYTPDLSRYIYLKGNPDGGHDLIAYEIKTDIRKTLAAGVDSLISADAKTLTALYQTKNANPLRYSSIINDNYAKEDKTAKKPDIENYPLLKRMEEGVPDTDDSVVLDEDEDFAEESAQYQKALEAYDKKLERDSLRREINDTLESFVDQYPVVYDLFLYREGSPERLAEGSYLPFDNATLDISKGFTVWTDSGWSGIDKILLTEYVNILTGTTLNDYLINKMTENIYFKPFNGGINQLSLGKGNFYASGWKLTENADGIYFAAGDSSPLAERVENSCSLYYAPIVNGTSGTIILVDENVDAIGEMLKGSRLLYYKERSGQICDLYLIAGTKSESIGNDISLLEDYYLLNDEGGTLLYCERFSDITKSGDLVMLSKQRRQIGTDVRQFSYHGDNLIYFLRGYKDGKAELYSFNRNGLVRFDENVTTLVR